MEQKVFQAPPEMFPLPQRGKDPWLMNGRTWYYDAEKRGLIRLIRVKKPGRTRGKVFVPYAEARALVRKLAGLDTPPIPPATVPPLHAITLDDPKWAALHEAGQRKRNNKWECFFDESYHDLWAVRPVGERAWGHCFHLNDRAEAEGLAKLLTDNQVPSPFLAPTRDTKMSDLESKISADITEPKHARGLR